jgi:hypothetical protein
VNQLCVGLPISAAATGTACLCVAAVVRAALGHQSSLWSDLASIHSRRVRCGSAAGASLRGERFNRVLTRSFETWASSAKQCTSYHDGSGDGPPIRRIHHVQ